MCIWQRWLCKLLLALQLLQMLGFRSTLICSLTSVQAAGQAAGVVDPDRDGEPAVALEALRQLKACLESTQKDLEDYKLKVSPRAMNSLKEIAK